MSKRLDEAEWKLDCLNSRMDALQRSDAVSAAKYEEMINDVKYAVQSLKGCTRSEVPAEAARVRKALAQLNQMEKPRANARLQEREKSVIAEANSVLKQRD